MKAKIEYRMFDYDMFDEDMIREMNSMGEKGWKVIRILDPMKWLNSDGMFIRVFYEREQEQKGNEANTMLAIRAIVKTHTEKLNIMKNNLSRWEEERWTDAEMRECENMIRILASILSDLNRSLANER